jgi:hypothetical protein
VHALQVLQVREQLERTNPNHVPQMAMPMMPPLPQAPVSAPANNNAPSDTISQADLDDGEKALVREMCNV